MILISATLLRSACKYHKIVFLLTLVPPLTVLFQIVSRLVVRTCLRFCLIEKILPCLQLECYLTTKNADAAGDKVFERKTEERGRSRNCQLCAAAFAQNVEFMQINCPLSLLLSLRSLASAVRPSVHQLSFFYVPLWLQQLLFLP